MNDENFEGPPAVLAFLTVVGGIATAIGLILTLEYVSDRLRLSTPAQSMNHSVQISTTIMRSNGEIYR